MHFDKTYWTNEVTIRFWSKIVHVVAMEFVSVLLDIVEAGALCRAVGVPVSVGLCCREYLFRCAISSEPVTSTAYAERHLAVSLRDEKGVAVMVVDMNLGDATVALAAFERRQIGHAMKLLTAANAEVIADSQHGRRVICIGKSSALV